MMNKSLKSRMLIVALIASWMMVGSAMPLPKIHILATGGTISGKADERIMLSGYKSGSYSIEEILKTVPEIENVARITFEQVANVGSGSIDTDILLKLAKRINSIYAEQPDIDGVVVTHGTSTLEETAYFLNLTVISDKPVVLTGAMRPLSAISGDGPLNLYNAVRVAGSSEARGKGAMIVLNDEISSAREGTKTDTYRVETFNNREYGYLGYADPDSVVFYRKPTRRHTFASEFIVDNLDSLPEVEILYGGYQETGGDAIKALVDRNVEGIILASGSRNYQSHIDEAAEKGIVIVYSDRKGQGRVLNRPDRVSGGILTADNLRPQKARILLRLAMSRTKDPEQLQRIFDTY